MTRWISLAFQNMLVDKQLSSLSNALIYIFNSNFICTKIVVNFPNLHNIQQLKERKYVKLPHLFVFLEGFYELMILYILREREIGKRKPAYTFNYCPCTQRRVQFRGHA